MTVKQLRKGLEARVGRSLKSEKDAICAIITDMNDAQNARRTRTESAQSARRSELNARCCELPRGFTNAARELFHVLAQYRCSYGCRCPGTVTAAAAVAAAAAAAESIADDHVMVEHKVIV